MPNCGPFLPCVILRMSETPIWLRFRPPGGRKWANTDQNRLRCSGYMYMPDHPFHALSFEYHETPILSSFWVHQMAEIGPILAKIEPFLGVIRIHQHATFQAIPSLHAPKNGRNPQSHPNLTKFFGHHRAETGPLSHTLQFTPNIDQY